jgi:hypothetical protein
MNARMIEFASQNRWFLVREKTHMKLILFVFTTLTAAFGQITTGPIGVFSPPTPVVEVKARQAFQKQIVFDLSKGDGDFKASIPVPAGKILVIEHVTSHAHQKFYMADWSNGAPTTFTLFLTTKVDSDTVAHFIPYSNRNLVNYNSQAFLASERTQIYHEGGTPLVVNLSRTFYTIPGSCWVSISGYLVDAK